jgi:branched-chain amino acid transport system substrate-binding protein
MPYYAQRSVSSKPEEAPVTHRARRRTLALALTAVIVSLGIGGIAPAAEPIKVGFLGPMSGIFAQAGKDMLDGLKMGLDASGNQAAGRKIELIDELPSLFLTTPDELTKRKPPKWILRTNFAASQPMHPLGDYAAKILKYKRVAAIAMDNPFGHECLGGFQRVFEDAGGKVVQKTWVPLNAMDFAPYLAQVPRDVDAVVQVFVAGQAVRFAKQYAESGLKDRHPLLGIGVFTDESALRSMGDEAIGTIGTLIWAPTLTTPANQAFMKMAEARLKRTPAYFHAVMYSAGRWIAAAAAAIDGKVEERARFLAAIRKASETTEDPRGPIKLDEYNNPTQNVYVLKVEKVGGRLQNTVIHTYPMVSQFWTYKPEEFLKSPPYDRNYPPVKP